MDMSIEYMLTMEGKVSVFFFNHPVKKQDDINA